MNKSYILLTEKEEMWAKMLLEVLTDNGIPCCSLPVHGAGLVIRAGVPERLRVFVPSEYLDRAKELVCELFEVPEPVEDLEEA